MSNTELKIYNARILSSHLGAEDHGIPTATIVIEAQIGGGGFGGFDLRYHGIDYVTTLLSALGVSSWERLPGTLIRAASNGFGSAWAAVGHIMEDRWFVCDEDGPRIVTQAVLSESK